MTEILGNIVLVGETGVGKSSIINMIAGTKIAKVSNGAAGCTFDATPYTLPVHGRNYKFFDTVGLNEGEMGTVTRPVAIANLYKLITRLDGGISLLMFCMRGPRIKDATHQNWAVFHDIICKKEIPTLLVVTGLENEPNMNKWWWDNRETFEDQGIHPDDTACITATRGRKLRDGSYASDEHYEESQDKILNMILNRVLLRPPPIDRINWFYSTTRSIFAFFSWIKIRDPKVVREIAAMCGMSREETSKLRDELGQC